MVKYCHEETTLCDFLTRKYLLELLDFVSLDSICCDMGQNDTIGKIELNSSFVLSSDNTNCKNDIQ